MLGESSKLSGYQKVLCACNGARKPSIWSQIWLIVAVLYLILKLFEVAIEPIAFYSLLYYSF